MVRQAMESMNPHGQVFLLCGSWYPKGCVANLVDECHNLDIICNTRLDTVMYGFPRKRTEKRGRPKKYGGYLLPEDFGLESPKTEDWKVGVRLALTRLWGGRGFMPLSLSPKADMAAAGCSSTPKIRKRLYLTIGIVQSLQCWHCFHTVTEPFHASVCKCAGNPFWYLATKSS